MKKLGYLGIDQYGNHYHIKKYPRKELSEQIGVKHIRKMYVDEKGKAKHVGYAIGGQWIDIFTLCTWDGGKV